ncbi:MAG: biotin/lipoyl-binding protein [Methylococcaceae bacterium]
MSTHEAPTRTFSDAWHRVASVRAALRSGVQAHRQFFQGEHWVILRDSMGSDWFRVSADAFQFISRMSLDRTIDEVWQETLAVEPDLALSQEEIVQLLGQLNLSNLLQYDRSSASASLFTRYTRRRNKERLALWMGFLSIRIPVFDPDRHLEQARPFIDWLLGRTGIGLYLLLLISGLLALVNRADDLFHQSAGVLAPGNLILLYVGFVIAKLVHELGHAAVCKYYGGEVHTLGLMLLMFAPMPYVDASSSWGFRNRWHRVFTGFAGVLAELSVAAVAALIWANTAPGTLNAMAYNVIFASSISTVLFNLNPLLRFDGYHILVDLLDTPNLYQRSREQLRYLIERFIFRLPTAQPAAHNPAEAWILPTYGVLSLVYWVVLMFTIIFFIAQQYLDLGVILAWFMGFSVLIMPLFKLLRYLLTDPKLGAQRVHAGLIRLLLGIALIGVLGIMPVPDRVRIKGVVEATHFRQLHTDSAGRITELLSQPGSRVEAGQTLLRMENPELLLEIEAVKAQLAQLKAQELRAVSQAVADLAPMQQQRRAVEQNLAQLEIQREALTVTSPISGLWNTGEFEATLGRWVARGGVLGSIVEEGDWRFVAVLPQVGTHLFEDHIQQSEIRLAGQEENNLTARSTMVVPHENGILPSKALGMAGGGEIAVDPADSHGLAAAEPFFRVQAELPPASGTEPLLVHGRLGVMRLTLSARPLLFQWERGLRQFLQRRFRV